MFDALKRTIGICIAGVGIGVLLVLLLPAAWWLFLIGAVLLIVGLVWLLC